MYDLFGKRKLLLGILSLFIILGILLNLPQVRDLPILKGLRWLCLSVSYPFHSMANLVTSKVGQTFKVAMVLSRTYAENERLKKELAQAKAQNSQLEELVVENQKLRKLLGLKQGGYKFKLIPAEIVARSPSNWFEGVLINKGTKDGLKEDMAVINTQGVVGRTVEVGRNTAKVLLLTDPESAISAIDQRSRDMGVVIGQSVDPPLIKYILSTAQIQEGDLVVTGGMSEVFPKGLKVGKVSKVEKNDYDIFQKVEIQPAVDFGKLGELFVIRK